MWTFEQVEDLISTWSLWGSGAQGQEHRCLQVVSRYDFVECFPGHFLRLTDGRQVHRLMDLSEMEMEMEDLLLVTLSCHVMSCRRLG